jgi:respiratory burst oxidase
MRGGGGGGPGVGTPGRPRWGSGATTPRSLSTGSSPRGSDRSSDDGEELVEVTLDLLEDDNIVLRSVEPAAAGSAAVAAPPRRHPDPTPSSSGAPSRSRSPAMRRTSSHRLLQFSQELKATANRAKQFSQDLTKRFTRTQSRANLADPPPATATAAAPSSGIDAALEARAQRRRRAQLDRTKSGAQRAIRGLRFISGGNKASNAWIEVQANFDRLARDGYLSRADFPKCIGSLQSPPPFPSRNHRLVRAISC